MLGAGHADLLVEGRCRTVCTQWLRPCQAIMLCFAYQSYYAMLCYSVMCHTVCLRAMPCHDELAALRCSVLFGCHAAPHRPRCGV